MDQAGFGGGAGEVGDDEDRDDGDGDDDDGAEDLGEDGVGGFFDFGGGESLFAGRARLAAAKAGILAISSLQTEQRPPRGRAAWQFGHSAVAVVGMGSPCDAHCTGTTVNDHEK